jgi:hypothetical protein
MSQVQKEEYKVCLLLQVFRAMKRKHFDKLCKELERLEIIEESLGIIRVTGKFRNLLVNNIPVMVQPKIDLLNETIILSVLDVCKSVEYNLLADYCCIIKGTLLGASINKTFD